MFGIDQDCIFFLFDWIKIWFLQAIRNQVVAGEIEHVVIDNLQFLVGLAILNNETANSFERFHQQVVFLSHRFNFW